MNRRNFVIMSISAIALSALPSRVFAQDYRTLKPNAWTAHTVDDAIKAMYGHNELIQSGVSLTAPKEAANGAAISVKITSDIEATSVALFQDANPESAVAIMQTNEHSIINYDFKIKMQEGPGTIIAVLEGKDGKLYAAKHTLVVAKGGCEG